jgi:fatty-acyl-CoA synthase
LGSIRRGACLAYLDAFDPERALDLIERFRCTIHFGVETMIRDELALPSFDDYDLSSLRVCAAGASPDVRKEVRRRFRVPTLLSMYGMTEAHGNVTLTGPDDPVEMQDLTFGRPHPGIALQIVDPETRAQLPVGEEGEIRIHGRCVFDGYYGQAEATAAAIGPDGWLNSGDLGRLDAEGYLYFRGRLKDKVRVGGENVSLSEVDASLAIHPAVEQAYSIGLPDERLGEVIASFVRLKPGHEANADVLIEHARALLADFKTPRHIFLVDHFPLGGVGRVSRDQLRRWAEERLARA